MGPLERFAGQLRAKLDSGSGSRLVTNGWSLGAAGYLIGIVVYVIAVVFFQIANLDGASFAQSLYALLGRNLVVASPALITCVNLAIRAAEHGNTTQSRDMAAWTIAGCALLGPVLAVGELLGGIGALASGGSGGAILVAVIIQLAGIVVVVAASIWAIAQVPPVQPVSTPTVPMGQPPVGGPPLA